MFSVEVTLPVADVSIRNVEVMFDGLVQVTPLLHFMVPSIVPAVHVKPGRTPVKSEQLEPVQVNSTEKFKPFPQFKYAP